MPPGRLRYNITVHLRTIRYLDKGHVMFIDRELLLALDRYLKVDPEPEREGAPTYYFNMA